MKLLLAEPGANEARRAWRGASSRTSSVALLAETRSALASAHRGGRLDDSGHVEAVDTFVRLWSEIDGIELTEGLAFRAGELAEACALRGYDAIHLASAEAILDDGDVMVVSDERLAEAAASLGIEALIPAA